MKRFIILLLTIALLSCSASGLASQLTDMDRTIGTPEREAAESKTFAMYPIGEDITLTVWETLNSGAGKYIESYGENEALQAAQARTGVKLNFLHPGVGSSQAQEQFNLLMASGDLPDIMVTNTYYPGGPSAGVADGMFADLTDLIEEYSPTYAMILANNEDFWREATDPEGRVLAYYSYKEATAYDEGDHSRVLTRQDWLDEAGLDALHVIEDYEKYFDFILENKPDVVPYGLDKSGYSDRFMTAYGLLTNDFYKVDDVIHHFYNEPALKEYLTLMNEWYNKGYISPDFTTANPQQQFFAGQMASFVGNTSTTAIATTTMGFETAPQPYPRLYEGQLIHGPYKLSPLSGITSPTQITASSPHIKEAMKFIDYGYTLEGCYNYCFGPEGVAWEYDENGVPQYTDYVLSNDRFAALDDVNYVIRYHVGITKMRALDRDSIPYMTPKVRELRTRWMDDPNMDLDTVLPGLSFSEDAATERGSIMADVDTYAKEMILKFIVGSEPLDNFDTYVARLESMGLSRAIELTQEAYNTYMTKTRN